MKVRVILKDGMSVTMDVQPDPNYAKLLRVEVLDDDGQTISGETLAVDWKNRFSLSKDSYADPIWLAKQKKKEHAHIS